MLRSDLWAGAFVRRHNDLGNMCVVSRRGDPIAGQIFIEIDHLNGTVSLYVPAPTSAALDRLEDRLFQLRFAAAPPDKVRERIAREVDFDPDLWVLSLEMRGNDPGIEVVKG
jgi:hypothetical protein